MRLEQPEELRLQVQADLANLVEEDGAASGVADDAGELGDGAGERAAAVAEELAVEHVARDGGAVKGDERLRRALRGVVDDVREDLLAGTRLPPVRSLRALPGSSGETSQPVSRGRGGGEGRECRCPRRRSSGADGRRRPRPTARLAAPGEGRDTDAATLRASRSGPASAEPVRHTFPALGCRSSWRRLQDSVPRQAPPLNSRGGLRHSLCTAATQRPLWGICNRRLARGPRCAYGVTRAMGRAESHRPTAFHPFRPVRYLVFFIPRRRCTNASKSASSPGKCFSITRPSSSSL